MARFIKNLISNGMKMHDTIITSDARSYSLHEEDRRTR